jgi:hypothetical protein
LNKLSEEKSISIYQDTKKEVLAMKTIVLIIMLFVLTANILADIPPSPIGEKIRIELNQDYSEYQFFLCSYAVVRKANLNPPHPLRPYITVKVFNLEKKQGVKLVKM